MQPPQAPTSAGGANTQAAMEANMKMMQYMMPAMMGIFALFYSSAFTLYMFTSSAFTTAFQFIFNLVAKAKDKREEEKRLENTYK
jgi:membrane protein insertase Oxa1/YidC/SpoIIIJ